MAAGVSPKSDGAGSPGWAAGAAFPSIEELIEREIKKILAREVPSSDKGLAFPADVFTSSGKLFNITEIELLVRIYHVAFAHGLLPSSVTLEFSDKEDCFSKATLISSPVRGSGEAVSFSTPVAKSSARTEKYEIQSRGAVEVVLSQCTPMSTIDELFEKDEFDDALEYASSCKSRIEREEFDKELQAKMESYRDGKIFETLTRMVDFIPGADALFADVSQEITKLEKQSVEWHNRVLLFEERDRRAAALQEEKRDRKAFASTGKDAPSTSSERRKVVDSKPIIELLEKQISNNASKIEAKKVALSLLLRIKRIALSCRSTPRSRSSSAEVVITRPKPLKGLGFPPLEAEKSSGTDDESVHSF